MLMTQPKSDMMSVKSNDYPHLLTELEERVFDLLNMKLSNQSTKSLSGSTET